MYIVQPTLLKLASTSSKSRQTQQERNIEHCLYRFLDGQKKGRFQYSVPGLQGIHRNLKQQQKSIFARAFFQKIPFLSFFLYRFWVWQTLGHIMNIFSNCHIHNASKERFRPNVFFQISCMGSKVPFWQFFNFPKMALLNPCMKFEKISGLKHSFEAL